MWEHIQTKERMYNDGRENQLHYLDKLDGLFFDMTSGKFIPEDSVPVKLQLFSQVVEIVKGSRLVVSTIRDMSLWLELEIQKNLIKFKSLAFAQAAHEFRNPLNAIINSLDLIRSSITDSD